MNTQDTIAAISTPLGVGGIAVVRVSGPDAQAVCMRHLDKPLRPSHVCHSIFRDGDDVIDDVVTIFFAAPHSYTGDDVVEISCHGSLYVQQAILSSLTSDGCRLAEPGEFTQRAFLNGRLNLSQAEAVADLIESTTPSQHRLALSQLRGGYAQMLSQMRAQLVELTSLLELELDFSEEDVQFADRGRLASLVAQLQQEVARLTDSFRIGNAIKNGIPVAIVGEPNAGKSTLLNALLNDDRAIVSPIPGTTRDTIEETLNIDGISFRLIDTAGLRQSDDTVEQLGIERSRKAIAVADIVLHIVDCTSPHHIGNIDEQLQDHDKKVINVLNKADLLDQPSYGTFDLQDGSIQVSALNRQGLDAIRHALVEASNIRHVNNGDILLSNLRHLQALRHVQKALEQVEKGIEQNIAADLVAIDLRDALYHLGSITGEVLPDEILGTIFSRFCVGK